MPKVSEAHLEARRQQILDAAFACFAREGFHQTTMQDICKQAELSPGAIYRYFKSKDAIIEASCAESELTSAAILEEFADAGNSIETLDQMVRVTFADLDEPGAHLRLRVLIQWWAEAMRSAQLGDSLRRTNVDSWKDALAHIIKGAQALGEITQSIRPEAAARVLLSTWQGLVLQKALDPDVDVSSYADAVRLMYRGMLTDERSAKDLPKAHTGRS